MRAPTAIAAVLLLVAGAALGSPDADVLAEMNLEDLIGRWQARRQINVEVETRNERTGEVRKRVTGVANRGLASTIEIRADGSYLWVHDEGGYQRGRWERTGDAAAPLRLLRGEEGRDWLVARGPDDTLGHPTADIGVTTGTATYSARKETRSIFKPRHTRTGDRGTSGTLRRR